LRTVLSFGQMASSERSPFQLCEVMHVPKMCSYSLILGAGGGARPAGTPAEGTCKGKNVALLADVN
jgi:hypothetical protein